MKYYIPFVLFAAVLASCGNKADSLQAKKEQLAKYRKEAAELSLKIRELEKEIASKDSSSAKTKLVGVQAVAPGAFSSYVSVQGRVDADQSTIATSQAMGVVTRVFAQVGQNVSAGQTLAELDNTVLVQGINELKQQLEFATTVYEKQKALWDQKIGTEVQYLSAKNNKESLEKRMRTMNEQLELYKVKAPIAGTVDEVNVKVGQNMAPGIPAFRVVNLSGLKVKADVAESYVALIQKGDKVKVILPDISREVDASVSFVSRIIDPINRSFKVEVNMPNAQDLRPNMLAVVKVVDYQKADAISVPISTIQTSDGGRYVVVARDEKGKKIARKLYLEVGRESDGRAEIISGLRSGDELIVTGFQNLNEGEEVTIAK